jgi:hypothetical protein
LYAENIENLSDFELKHIPSIDFIGDDEIKVTV